MQRNFVILIMGMVLAAACSSGNKSPIDAGQEPDWQVVAPEAVGLSSEKLELAKEFAMQDVLNTHGVVVIKDGYLVAEWYGDDLGPEDWATSWSIGKSIASATLGIAWGDGLLKDLEIPMTEFVPEWEGQPQADITLRDILTMSSGLDWDETYNLTGGGASDVARMVLDPDPMETAISQPVTHPAGDVWNYSSGDTMLLSRVIQDLTGKNPTNFAAERLIAPLNISKFDWWEDPEGNTYTFCCVDMTVRSFAKFGQLFLQRGVWNGEQIIPEEWVRMTTEVTAKGNPGYGLKWWLNVPNDEFQLPSVPEDTYFGLGHNDQLLAVIPSLNMVIARHSIYIKPDNPAVAEESLFGSGHFSDGIGSTGTIPPDIELDYDKMVSLILDAVE